MPKLTVKQGFRITPEMMRDYPKKAADLRKATPKGKVKPSATPAWIVTGAVYIAGDVIEVTPVEAAELSVIAPEGALEAINA